MTARQPDFHGPNQADPSRITHLFNSLGRNSMSAKFFPPFDAFFYPPPLVYPKTLVYRGATGHGV